MSGPQLDTDQVKPETTAAVLAFAAVTGADHVAVRPWLPDVLRTSLRAATVPIVDPLCVMVGALVAVVESSVSPECPTSS